MYHGAAGPAHDGARLPRLSIYARGEASFARYQSKETAQKTWQDRIAPIAAVIPLWLQRMFLD